MARAHGIRTAANTPWYSGGPYWSATVIRAAAMHAIQLEFDRDPPLSRFGTRRTGPGTEGRGAAVADLIDAVADEALPGAIAAE